MFGSTLKLIQDPIKNYSISLRFPQQRMMCDYFKAKVRAQTMPATDGKRAKTV
jgi:hypothetical protein